MLNLELAVQFNGNVIAHEMPEDSPVIRIEFRSDLIRTFTDEQRLGCLHAVVDHLEKCRESGE